MRSKVAQRIQDETPKEVRELVREITTIKVTSDANEVKSTLMVSNAKNQGTQEQADDLAREINKTWWTENKHRFIDN